MRPTLTPQQSTLPVDPLHAWEGETSGAPQPASTSPGPALLPQFVTPNSSTLIWLGHALVLPLLGKLWLSSVVTLAGVARELLLRRRIRRTMEAVTGAALLGFGVRIARRELIDPSNSCPFLTDTSRADNDRSGSFVPLFDALPHGDPPVGLRYG